MPTRVAQPLQTGTVQPAFRARDSRVPGVATAVAIAVLATVVGGRLPLLGAPVCAILVGVLVRLIFGRNERLERGVAFSATPVLQLAVVVLGSQLSLREIADVGVSGLPVMVATLGACFLAAWLLGPRLGIDRDLGTLIGAGTAICGASAIAAVSPVIRARSHTVAYAISTIFFFNIAAVLVFPPLGHLLGLSQAQFGVFAGTAVNDTSSVVAAATIYGAAAANHAVVVKLTRSLMIIPTCLVLGALARRRLAAEPVDGGVARRTGRLVPWFLIAFVMIAAANSVGLIPAELHGDLQRASVFLITVALAGIGLSTDVGGFRRAGFAPLLLGAILWIVVAATSLGVQLVA